MEGLAVESRFQSSLVISIFREMGVLGGAAKLNQDVLSSRRKSKVIVLVMEPIIARWQIWVKNLVKTLKINKLLI